MEILVTGGAGYVGSHIVRTLLERDHGVVVVDDLSSGHRRALPPDVPLTVGDCGDPAVLEKAVGDRPVEAVMHMAARTSVGESMERPELYYRTNLTASLELLDWMLGRDIPWIVHSSTCAVYGEIDEAIDEEAPPTPVSAYGATKLAVDRAIGFYGEAHALQGVALRYFNAAGAHPSGDLGEDKSPATNLIPRVLGVALGRYDRLAVYGDDYATTDGTGVRDYVHVLDLAAAHVAALDALTEGHEGGAYNLGTGTGHSVLEVVETAREVTGEPIPLEFAGRRAGDPASLVAASDRAQRELGWSPRRSDLRTILEDAWRWHHRWPGGYEEMEETPADPTGRARP